MLGSDPFGGIRMSIGVIGCGLMGNGIIHSLAINGQRVIAVKHHSEDNSFLDYINKELKRNDKMYNQFY